MDDTYKEIADLNKCIQGYAVKIDRFEKQMSIIANTIEEDVFDSLPKETKQYLKQYRNGGDANEFHK